MTEYLIPELRRRGRFRGHVEREGATARERYLLDQKDCRRIIQGASSSGMLARFFLNISEKNHSNLWITRYCIMKAN